jgi:hypothetical protein
MLSKTSIIDLVTKDDRAETYELVLVVERYEWSLPTCHALLQEKLNAYLDYILDGQMQRDYPGASVDRVKILIQSEHYPPQTTATFIKRLIDAAKVHGANIKYIPLQV